MSDIPLLEPTIPYDFNNYIVPGVAYGHWELKQAYYNACRDIYGTRFRLMLHDLYRQGVIQMPKVKVDGEKIDFFSAVMNSYPNSRTIEGFLVLDDDNAAAALTTITAQAMAAAVLA